MKVKILFCLLHPLSLRQQRSSMPGFTGGGFGGGGAATSSLAGLNRPSSASSQGAASSNIRCICGQITNPFRQIECTNCGKNFHQQCYGAMPHQRRAYPALCFMCMSLTQDPFMKVEHTLVEPLKVGGPLGRRDISISYKLSNPQQREIMESRSANQKNKEGSLRLVLRCYPLNLLEMNKGKIDPTKKPPFYPPHCWPLDSMLRVNNDTVHVKQVRSKQHFAHVCLPCSHPHHLICISCTPTLQRQVYFHGVHKKWKGSSEPVDLFMQSRTGSNRLTLSFRDDNAYVLVLQIVRVISVEQLSKVCPGVLLLLLASGLVVHGLLTNFRFHLSFYRGYWNLFKHQALPRLLKE